jgi:hypothetical protein
LTNKVQNVASAPVCMLPKWLIYWSGRLDSNQRPLPPERTAPSRKWRISVVFHAGAVVSDGLFCRSFTPKGSSNDLGALSFGGVV